MISTSQPHEKTVLDTIRDLGLEFQVIFNKGAVMILPSGSNKATGLAAALKRMELSPRHVVGVGDAENDHAFLKLCQFSVAVANALSTLKEEVDFVTAEENGAGVRSLIEEIIATDLPGTGGGFVSGDLGGRTYSRE
jgi:hydroxymethylpyrimidine pyrophosphatase-like HAD family hydrolase